MALYKYGSSFSLFSGSRFFMQMLFPTLTLAALACLTVPNVHAQPIDGQYHHDISWLSRHLGTKSPYPVPTQNFDKAIRGYTLEQLQLVVRHGTRYPSDGDTEDIAAVLEKLQKSTNKTALGWLDDYENMYLPRRAGALDKNGEQEEFLHGRRVAKSFPKLIDAILDEDVFLSIDSASSWSERTTQSAIAFHMGVFEGRGALGTAKHTAVAHFTYPDEGDQIIAIDDNCPAWSNATENSDAESDLYQVKAHTATAKRLSKDLGISLTPDDVDAIYTGCCFDVSHQQRPDTFCTLLSRQEILQGEYREDLSYFYEYSFGGNPLNGQVACALMQDIMQHIEKNDVRLVLKFGHTQTVLFLQNFLGVYDDKSVLTANSSQSVIDNRVYRTSNIATFASNVGFQVLRKGKDRFVRVLVSEVPVVVPGCHQEICPLETFKKALASKLTCNIKDVCQN